MKKMIIGLAVALIFAVGSFAYAHGPGYNGSGGGHMMGQGYGGHMMGQGYGGHMMGQGCGGHMMGQGYGGHMMGQGYGGHMMGQGYGGHMTASEDARSEDNKKFLDETRELRKELHNKRFEYMELSRNSDTSADTLENFEKEIYALEDSIREKAPGTAMGKAGNDGHCK